MLGSDCNGIKISNRDLKFLKVAQAVSATSNFRRIKIGACLVLKNKIISIGCNNKKSHPIQKFYNKNRYMNQDRMHHYIHAEIQAIINANCDLNGSVLYVYREDRNGDIAICKPCKACMELIHSVGIKKIIYTINNDIISESLV